MCSTYSAGWLVFLRVSVTVSIAAGLLVMVSSELVVLLIVCVGINTGSALQSELTTELTSLLFTKTQIYKAYSNMFYNVTILLL